MAGKLRVTLRKSTVSTTRQARGTVRALGLHRIGQAVDVPDTPQLRGMIRAVRYLVTAEPVAGTEPREQPGREADRPVAPGATEETGT
jgi:large subunit ribosomal protein L30